MSLVVVDVYNVRFGLKLPLPKSVQDNIGRLRITPVAYKPVRTFVRNGGPRHRTPAATVDNWREKALVEMVRRVREREDPEYSDVFSIFNKLALSNLDKLSHDAIELIQKRDEQFRLRVTTLLFDKAITQSAFSTVMAECAFRLNTVIPEIAEDLQAQISMFPKLYDLSDTVTFPDAKEDGFEDKVVTWMKQKDKRRGYAKFMMELFVKDLIPEIMVRGAFEQVVKELNELAKYPLTERTAENTTQFVEFLFECSKTAKGSLKEYIKEKVQSLLKIPKAELPSLNMRCRFKLEDALKLLEKKGQE
jgi:hypothetical protein